MRWYGTLSFTSRLLLTPPLFHLLAKSAAHSTSPSSILPISSVFIPFISIFIVSLLAFSPHRCLFVSISSFLLSSPPHPFALIVVCSVFYIPVIDPVAIHDLEPNIAQKDITRLSPCLLCLSHVLLFFPSFPLCFSLVISLELCATFR